MKKHNQYISILLTLLIFMGMSVSVLHSHSEKIDIHDFQQEIVQDHNFCALCAPFHKVTPVPDTQAESFTQSDIYRFIQGEFYVNTPGEEQQNPRAPPFIA